MKAELNRLGSAGFEELVQALVEGVAGFKARIYGGGKDGQRDAVIEHAQLSFTKGVTATGRTIVQAKYKSPDGEEDNWDWLLSNLKKELDGFRSKAAAEPDYVPETWIFFTNLILTPAKDNGLKDKADRFLLGYSDLIPHIYLLGADEIRSMLDNNREVARRFAAFLTPSDVLADALDYLHALKMRKFQDLIEYVQACYSSATAVKLEQSGGISDKRINIHHVFTDLEAKAQGGDESGSMMLAQSILAVGDQPHRIEQSLWTDPPRQAPDSNVVLLGNAGQGKSTICQYVAQLYRVKLLQHYRPNSPTWENYFETGTIPPPNCERFPVLIQLKSYAKWLNKKLENQHSGSLLHYLAEQFESEAHTSLPITELRELLSSYSWAFFFDGLDEVSASSNRSEVVNQLRAFMENDLTAAGCDCLIVITSRPQGYAKTFSPAHFRHFELMDMSPETCMSYVDRLLYYIEDNAEQREQYRETLKKAMKEATVSKLMTTPLYTSIVVLLVKAGGTPPTKRYELFEEYTETVIRRERQKGLLPCLFEDDYAWIRDLHAEIGFLLQKESETAYNSAAELSSDRLFELVLTYLDQERWDGDKKEMAERICSSLTERLSFLSATTDVEARSCVVFPLRSLQEYFAAEKLIHIEDVESINEILEQISLSAYWRNVYLFVAGYYSKNPDKRVMNDILYNICLRDNGDPAFDNPDTVVCRKVHAGSLLALDFLRDNLFERRGGQKRYLELAAKLVCEFEVTPEITTAFLGLPVHLFEKCMRDKVIPQVEKSLDGSSIAFHLLWLAAVRGTEGAREKLDEYVERVSTPSSSIASMLLCRNMDNLGVKSVDSLMRWATECYLEEFFLIPNSDEIWRLIHTWLLKTGKNELPFPLRREIAYICYGDSYKVLGRDLDEDKLFGLQFFSNDPVISRLASTELTFGVDHNFGPFSIKPVFRHWPEYDYEGLEECLEQNKLTELAKLTAFLIHPSYDTLAELLRLLPLMGGERGSFENLLRECNYLLQDICDQLKERGDVELILRAYEGDAFAFLQKRERMICKAMNTEDIRTLAQLNAFGCIGMTRQVNYSHMQEMLDCTTNENIVGMMDLIGFRLSRMKDEQMLKMLIPLHQRLYRSFSGVRAGVALFHELPVADLVSSRMEYPTEIPEYCLEFYDTAFYSECMKKVRSIATLGGEYLAVYAMIPYLYRSSSWKDLHDMADDAVEHYAALVNQGNDCAIFGCVLVMLSGVVPGNLRETVSEYLKKQIETANRAWMLELFSDQFSLDSNLLLYDLISRFAPEENRNSLLCHLATEGLAKRLSSRTVAENTFSGVGLLE